jgi:hypothetical protein
MRRALPRGLDLPSGSPLQYFFLFSFLYLFSNRFSISHICFAYQHFHPINVKRTSYEISMVSKQTHRIILNTLNYRVSSFLSSRQNWVPPSAKECCPPPPPVGPKGETYSLAGEGEGDPIPTKEKTLCYSAYKVLYFLYFI